MVNSPGSMNFGAPQTTSPPPPDHSPANVFASMKSGNFGGQDHAGPAPRQSPYVLFIKVVLTSQIANYDAMRSAPGGKLSLIL
jgi:hypothetical protein